MTLRISGRIKQMAFLDTLLPTFENGILRVGKIWGIRLHRDPKRISQITDNLGILLTLTDPILFVGEKEVCLWLNQQKSRSRHLGNQHLNQADDYFLLFVLDHGAGITLQDLSSPPSRSLHFLVFDTEVGLPLNLQGFVDAGRFHLGILVENVGDLTSYCLRRVGPSVAGLAELSEPEKVALGGWIDKNHGVAATPARYDATKERLSCQLKMALRYTLLWIINTMGFGTWGQVSMRACSSINSPKSSPLERGQREEKSHSFYTSGKGKLLGFQSLRPSQLMN